MRIEKHPILNFTPGNRVSFTFEHQTLEGIEGEPIAAALHSAGIKVYRISPRLQRPRGFFCAIGNCSSCLMVVDGRPNVKVCITPLKAGMIVNYQQQKGDLNAEN